MPSKKSLKKQINKLVDEINELENMYYDKAEEARSAHAEAAGWRKNYELAVNTPETKADTEAAFNRGAAHKYSQMRSFLVQEMTRLIDGLNSTLPKEGNNDS